MCRWPKFPGRPPPRLGSGLRKHRAMADDPARESILKGEEGAPRQDPLARALLSRALLSRVTALFPGAVGSESHGQLVLHVPLPRWREVAGWLRDEEEFDQCVLLTAVDHLRNPARAIPDGVGAERFEVVAAFLSHPRNCRVRMIAQVPVENPEVPSMVRLFPGVELPEREVFDLFGLRFEGHPDLVRLLMPDDWEGHPLRKDDAPARVPVQFKATGAR